MPCCADRLFAQTRVKSESSSARLESRLRLESCSPGLEYASFQPVCYKPLKTEDAEVQTEVHTDLEAKVIASVGEQKMVMGTGAKFLPTE